MIRVKSANDIEGISIVRCRASESISFLKKERNYRSRYDVVNGCRNYV